MFKFSNIAMLVIPKIISKPFNYQCYCFQNSTMLSILVPLHCNGCYYDMNKSINILQRNCHHFQTAKHELFWNIVLAKKYLPFLFMSSFLSLETRSLLDHIKISPHAWSKNKIVQRKILAKKANYPTSAAACWSSLKYNFKHESLKWNS